MNFKHASFLLCLGLLEMIKFIQRKFDFKILHKTKDSISLIHVIKVSQTEMHYAFLSMNNII